MGPKCSNHSENEAQAVCLEHLHLLCVDCLINKESKENDCALKALSKLTSSKEKTLLQLACVNIAVEKKGEILETKNLESIKAKDGLSEKVEEFYAKLAADLRAKKENTLRIIDNKQKSMSEEYKSSSERIDKLKNIILDMKTEFNEEDSSDTKAKIAEILLELKQMPEDESIKSSFSPLKSLSNIIKSDDSLGEIDFETNQSTYDTADVNTWTSTETNIDHLGGFTKTILYSSSDEGNSESTQIEPPQIPPRPAVIPTKADPLKRGEHVKISSAIELTEKEILSGTKDEHAKNNATSECNEKQKTKKQQSEQVKQKKRFSLLFKKNEECGEESVYEPVEVQEVSRQLDERILKLSPEDFFQEAPRITQIAVSRSEQYIALLNTRPQPEVVLVATDGKIVHKLSYSEPLFVTSAGDSSFAILREEGKTMKITTCSITNETKVDSKDFSTKITHEDVIGLNYDFISKSFACISREKVYILKETGKSRTVMAYAKKEEIKNEKVLKAVYDFSSKCLFILKVTESMKVVKCYSFMQNDYSWKKNVTDVNLEPRDIALYGDVIVVLCQNSIFRLSRKEGGVVATPVTSKFMPAEAISMCVLVKKDMVVVTTSSEDVQNAISLGFVKL